MSEPKARKTSRISYLTFRFIRKIISCLVRGITIVGAENLPEGGAIVVGNHSQMNGPIYGELYFPGERLIWCAHQMMELKEVPGYAFQDFWSKKPKWTHWFFRGLSYVIAPLSVAIFNNARTIPVYHDNRLISTFRQTVNALQEGKKVLIFPECYTPHNNIVYEFQDRFIDVAKLAAKRTGKPVYFVPMYLAPYRKEIHLGKPTVFDPTKPLAEERVRICNYLMDEITNMALALPRHRVVPYPNLPKKQRPYSTPLEVYSHETTGC